MSEVKHTPGPWTVKHMVVWAQPKKLADGGTYYQPIADCETRGNVPIDELFANARLIAAAPDMLAALEEISKMYGATWDRVDGGLTMMSAGVERFEKAHEAVQQAIARATGLDPGTASVAHGTETVTRTEPKP